MKIAFVIPWFYSKINGGAENLCKETVNHLQGKGHDITILTTCRKDHNNDWNINHFPEGEAREENFRIIRFKVDPIDHELLGKINAKYISMNESTKYQLPAMEETSFFETMAPSSELLEYIQSHQQDFDCFIFIPYLFASTLFGLGICPHKSIVIPCLHDEGYAYSALVAKSLSKAAGIIFNSREEQKLAEKIIPHLNRSQEVIGQSIPLNDCRGNAENFRNRYGINDPFVLYVGRKDATKRSDVMIQYFVQYKKLRGTSLKLVLVGSGQIDTLGSPDILDLGFLSKEDKYGAFAACSCFCNPSLNESFSIVLLEAWANRKPALVASHCLPTKAFCANSNGGLWFANYSEFVAVLDYLEKDKETASAMGENGYEFVKRNYTMSIIADRYDRTLRKWLTNELSGKDDYSHPSSLQSIHGPVDAQIIMDRIRSNLTPFPKPPPPKQNLGGNNGILKKLKSILRSAPRNIQRS